MTMPPDTPAWPRVKWTRATQIAPFMGDDAATLPADDPPAAAFAAMRGERPAAAVRFAAHALPRMDAARWMAACLALAPRPSAPALLAADKAVRRWVGNPADEARRIAFEAGEAAGFATPQGAACLAIFLSGGSLAPAGQDVPVNPAPGTFGQAVAGAVLAAAYDDGALAFPARIAAMLDLVNRIAAGESVEA